MRRTLFVVSAGLEAVPGLESLKRMGLRLVVSDRDPDAPGFALADERVLASTYDAEATARAAARLSAERRIDGVLSIAADVPRTVAAVAARLGLPGPSLETARLATDKVAMKQRFVDAGVPVPWFAEVASPAHLESLRAERGGTVVVKPVDSRGARGVLRIGPDVDANEAFACARAASRSHRVMAEEYVRGPQLSTESIVQSGEVFTLGCSDRNYEHVERFAPYLIENGGLLPSVHADAHGAEVDRVLCDAAAALGLERGVLKGDIVLDRERGPVVIEVAPRLSGGWLCTDQIPWATGVELVQLAARLALGETLAPAELVPRRKRAIAVRYFFPPAGVLRAVAGFEELAALPWIRRAMLFVRPGEVIAPVTDHTKRVGVVLAAGDDGEEAVRRAEEAVEAVRFDVTESVATNARS